MIVRHAEYNVQHTALHIRQTEQAAEQHRAHIGYSHANRHTVLTENIPKPRGIAFKLKIFQCKLLHTGAYIFTILTGHAHAGQIALGICQKDGYAHIGKRFRHHLHGDGFTGTGSTGDQAMAVRHLRQQEKGLLSACHENFLIFQHDIFSFYICLPPVYHTKGKKKTVIKNFYCFIKCSFRDILTKIPSLD